MLLAPYQVDVPMSRWPVANFAIIGTTSLVFLELRGTGTTLGNFRPLILSQGNPTGLFGYMLLHGG